MNISRDDVRAAVAAGVLSEAQAASLGTLAARRSGLRAGLAADDEPFELFRGFSEIFISVGLGILLAGVAGMVGLLVEPVLILGTCAALCVLLAFYFTRQRRMVLPSIVLVVGFAASVAGLMIWLLIDKFILPALTGESIPIGALVAVPGVTALALAAWYWLFRLPFTMLLLGLAVLAVMLALVIGSTGEIPSDWRDIFDLALASSTAATTLVFGIGALIAGTWFDMRDPHRLGRASATGFWLHVLAAPAIVNTLGETAISGDAYFGLAALLIVVALIALILDRRSFLTAGIGYLAWLIWYWSGSGSGLEWPVVLLLIGGLVTALGTWWTWLRGTVVRALPDFPGKDRLPPYA